VGWSYGGNVICDYVRSFGSEGLAGVNFVAGATKADPAFFGSGRIQFPDMSSEDLAANIASTGKFVHACFERQPDPHDFETMLAFNMVVPPRVRSGLMGRPPNRGDVLEGINCPVLVTHGVEDRILLVALGKFTASAIPGAKLSLYEGIGHAAFWEDAPRFNRELVDFVRLANK
jgi:non-heme chloroperoxidase